MDNDSGATSSNQASPRSPANPATQVAKDLSGSILGGDFVLLRRLGQGGMGEVYLAEQRTLKRKVAVKIMRADLAADPIALQRFKAEAEAVARVTHANIVQVYAVGEENGVHFMALEYVEGRNLREYVARKGPPDVGPALGIMRQAAAALQRAAEMGIIHRDVKPENLLLTRKGEVKVADFGLSCIHANDRQPLNLTQSGVTMGSPLYMSPEQVEGKPLDPRTDIYSLGATSYYMLAGQPPFRGETAFQLAIQHVQNEPKPLGEIRPDLPREVCELVQRMMAKDPGKRPQTCKDLIKELARLRETQTGVKSLTPVPASDPAMPVAEPFLGPTGGRRRWLIPTLAASILLAVVTGFLLGRNRPAPQATVTNRSTPATADDGIGSLFSATEREQFLKLKVQEFANPGGDGPRRRQGVDFALELGLIYLNQWRLDEAERFFSELISNPHKVKEYTTLAKAGRACVLAFLNNPRESNELFQGLASEDLPQPRRFDGMPFFLSLPQLRHVMARALDYNVANATKDQPFPADLEYLRRPLGAFRRPADKNKAP